MRPTTYVDGLLVEWGESFFDQRTFWGPTGGSTSARRRSTPRKQKKTGGATGGSISTGGGRLEARAVRARLNDLTKQAPQVVVKLYGGGKGMKEVRQHLRYIARAEIEDQIALEDERGSYVIGREDIAALADSWREDEELPVPEVSPRREALNIVLSMPEGTDPIAVKKAARDFAAREFNGHYYAMALHTQDTPHYAHDKQDPPSPNPHVHLVVMKGDQAGRRLNPNRADLQRWREGFAQALREHGVDALATSRLHRLHRDRGWKQTTREMTSRLTREDPSRKPSRKIKERQGASDPAKRAARAGAAEKEVLRQYAEVTQMLAKCEDPTDRVLAGALADRFGLERPPPPAEPGHAGWDNRALPFAQQERQVPRGRTGTDDLER
jgi:hypothetical protein